MRGSKCEGQRATLAAFVHPHHFFVSSVHCVCVKESNGAGACVCVCVCVCVVTVAEGSLESFR